MLHFRLIKICWVLLQHKEEIVQQVQNDLQFLEFDDGERNDRQMENISNILALIGKGKGIEGEKEAQYRGY